MCEQLAAHSSRYAPFVTEETYAQYVARVRRHGTWGDAITLQAAADAFGISVALITSYDDAFFLEIQPVATVVSGRVLWLSFWAEWHYNSVVPKN